MSDDNKMWKGYEKAVKLRALIEKQSYLYRQMADTFALRAGYDLSAKGGASFVIIDESHPMRSRVDNAGRGKGKYGTRESRHAMNSIRGIVKIKVDGQPEITDELLEFHRKTRGVFLR